VIDLKTAPYSALVLRVSSGVLFLAHGLLKLVVFTPAGTAGYFESLGLPGFLAYLTIMAELVGGVALIVGFYSRIVAAALIPLLLVAAYLGHGANGWMFANDGGGWEFPIFWAFVLLAHVLQGEGAFSARTLSAKATE
jgi:putative oxidoreductase